MLKMIERNKIKQTLRTKKNAKKKRRGIVSPRRPQNRFALVTRPAQKSTDDHPRRLPTRPTRRLFFFADDEDDVNDDDDREREDHL